MAKTYDLSVVVCSIGGAPISGYGKDDALGFEWDEDIATVAATADGKHVYSRNNNRGATVTITLTQQSLAYPILAGMLEAQHGDNLGIHPPQILPLAFALIDPSNGDSFTSLECVFMTRPAPSKGKESGDVEFKVHLPNCVAVYGVKNLTLT